MARLNEEKRRELGRRIPGWGTDVDPRSRPGVPRVAPGVIKVAKKGEPRRQAGWESVVHPPDTLLTPVFGTAVPLKRLAPSGWIRRLAYRIPQDKSEHWVLLVLGDRFDAIESRLKPLAVGASLIGAGIYALRSLAAPKPRRRVLPSAFRARAKPALWQPLGTWQPI